MRRRDKGGDSGDGPDTDAYPTGGATARYGQPDYGSPYGGPGGARGDRPDEPGWGPPPRQVARDESGATGGLPYAPPPPPVLGPRRGRPGLIALFAFLVQLVVIAALGNQWVSDKLIRQLDESALVRGFAQAGLAFSWRVTRPGGLNTFDWSSYAGLGALLVFSFLFTLVLCRGPITFWRAFVAVWLSTIVASILGGVVGRLVLDDRLYPGIPGGKTANVLFVQNGPAIFAAAVVGLLVALVAALIAVATRRPGLPLAPAPAALAGPPADPEAPEPYYGATATTGVAGAPSLSKRDERRDEPRVSGPAAEDRTTAFPAVAGGAAAGAAAGAGAVALSKHDGDQQDDRQDERQDDRQDDHRNYRRDEGQDERQDEPRDEPSRSADESTAALPVAGGAAGHAEPHAEPRSDAAPDSGSATQALPTSAPSSGHGDDFGPTTRSDGPEDTGTTGPQQQVSQGSSAPLELGEQGTWHPGGNEPGTPADGGAADPVAPEPPSEPEPHSQPEPGPDRTEAMPVAPPQDHPQDHPVDDHPQAPSDPPPTQAFPVPPDDSELGELHGPDDHR